MESRNKWLMELAECDKVISNKEIDKHGWTANEVTEADENVSDDEVDEDLETEHHRLNKILGLPADTYSLTRIQTKLQNDAKYGIKSGHTHMNMIKFSPLSRGLQGAAIAIAAFATTSQSKASCWTDTIIDDIIEDGDTWYCKSYNNNKTTDRRLLTVLNLLPSLIIQKKNIVYMNIDEAVYTGSFRTDNPTEMHFVKAIKLFFNTHNACIITSPILNISIWREDKFFNAFDAQPRLDNLIPDNVNGSVKLMKLDNLDDVIYIILEKSNIDKENFVIYPISIKANVVINPDDIDHINEPERRPSAYNIDKKFRAIVKSTFHINHSNVTSVLQGRGHLIISIAAIIYTKLINAKKWTTPIIDLIFNQSHIFIIDLARVLGKKFDDTFDIKIDDIFGNIYLGIYHCKIKLTTNVIPGQGKKGKINIEIGLRDFFKDNYCGILEIKKIYYAIWKDDDKYYYLDPFSCDDEGYRVDKNDPDNKLKYENASGCVIMNSSINELIEIILENTGNTDKDPFFIHGINVLYIKTNENSRETIVYREKNTNRRPIGVDNVVPIKDECIVEIDMTPKPRLDNNEKNKNIYCQYPDIMKNGDDYVSVRQQTSVMIIDYENEELLKFYKIINSNRFIIHASSSCIDDKFLVTSQGRQGLSMALSAIYFSKIKHPSQWQTNDLDKIIYFGDKTHGELVDWICRGSPEINDDDDDEDEDDEDDEDDDENDEEEDEEKIEKNEEKKNVKLIKKIPNYIDIKMLPKKLKIDNNTVKFKIIKSIIEGNADPMVNLGEAFEQYFRKYNELIIENKNLTYIIWKQDGNYFTFNPYGGDEEGWRYYGCPASFVVTDKITELVDLFYGILEFNDKTFKLHFINIEKIGPNNKYKSPLSIDLTGIEFEKYQTVFLPLTDDDILALKPQGNKTLKDNDESDEDEEGDDDDDDDDEDEEDDDDEEDKKEKDKLVEEEKEEEDEILVDPLSIVEEQNHPDTPSKLNLFLLTANINLQDEIIDQQAKEAIEYEKLKYNHPPPYVLPQKKVLKMLLNAKKASKSISSLVSCFSIDSKLAIKTYLTQYNNDINAIITNDNITSTKLIKLPKKKYLISRISPIGFTPLRAINDIFIHDENEDIINMKKCQDKNLIIQNENLCFSNELTKFTNDNNIKPLIIPIGPIIKTPISVKIAKPCMKNNKKRQCKLSADERDNLKLDKIVCYTEDILFNMLFPMKSINNENEQFKIVENNRDIETANDGKKNSSISMNANRSSDEYIDTQSLIENEDFISTNNDSIFIISANMKLENRNNKEEHHHKACYYAAILCILAKTVKNIHEFYGSLLDQLIILASKYYNKTGLLRYKQVRNFRNINILNIKFNIIVKQIIYADPENYENDLLTNKIKEYLSKYPSGILIFDNASYAFWFSNGCYYIFDPYPCDDEGHASDTGTGCVLKYCKLDDMIDKISNYSGVDVTKPYRIHNLSIGHIEMINHDDNKKTKFTLKENNKSDDENAYEKEDYHDVVDDDNDDKSEDDNEEEQEILKSKSQESLIELTSWLDEVNKNKKSNTNLTPKPAYVALNNLHASVLEVTVVEDDITQAILTPFKLSKDKNITNEYIRKKPYIRKFNKQSIILLPIDLCIISWSCIIDPSKWSENIIKAIYETSKDISFDCLLSSEDFTVDNMIDGMLTEFEIGNYNFKTVFAPLHIGKLYSHQGWNLSMSLKKIFDNSIYTGAIIFCGTSHIGVMKKLNKLYAWWCIDDTKNIKIIMSDNMEDYLKIIIQKINITEEIEFKIRIITVSYAKILDPNCSDIGGLHDEIMPSSSLPQIHQNNNGPYDLHAIFKPTIPGLKPIFVFGTVALDSFDIINEPNVKRCYFVGILSVMMKRDIIQSPMPSIIDKIIKLSEDLYRQFNQPKYHTEHIIHNVNLMNRIFEFRDVASSLNVLHNNHEKNNFFSTVKKELKKYFNKHNDGVIHFSNCCYGFWYSQSTNCYYYLDPYRCNAKGKRQLNNIGNSCLKIFSTLCQMIESMSKNKINNTTGFFIHQIHIESINALTDKNFKEDFMWIYLDYHWSFSHQKLPSVLDKKLDNKTNKKRKKNDNICKNLNDDNDQNKNILYWNNYVIEIPQLIYSLWGTIGTYDERFANRIGKNKMAICISIIAMQNLCHPSKWTSAILDSAVICGDCYYIESIKNKRNNLMDNDGFNLQSCFKIYPHIWKIKYLPKKCGVLYDNNDKLSLAVTLKLALEESNNILLNCDNITIGIIKCEDGYYAVDPCWTGPPLFIRNHGAVYVLRCRNISALIYALIKMINTNLRLEFNITPIIFEYKKEICKSSNVKTMKKKIFMEPLDTKPGFTRGPCTPVPGSITAGNQDIYSEYKNNIKLGMEHGSELENPIIPSPIPHLSDERTKNFMISTKWHKYSGQNQPRKSSSPIDDINIYDNPKMTSSSPSFLDVCDDYPKTIDFIDDKLIKSKIKQQKNKTSLSIPLDCLPPKKFILKENKKEYKKTIAEMSDDVYKNYQHQSKVEKKTDEQLDEDLDEKLVEDVDKSP